MKELLRHIQEDVLTEPDRFESEVKLYVAMQGGGDVEVEHNPKTSLQYQIEVEYRSYGIKGIYLNLDKPLKVFFTIEGEAEQRQIDLDFRKLADERKLNISWGQGAGYFVEGLSVYLDESGSIGSVDVDCVYAVPVGA